MESKLQDRFWDESLGFPVMLVGVPMKKIRDEWIPDIRLNEYQEVVLWVLVHKPSPLTGRQVRFIRHWMGKTQQEFAEQHDVTHAAVSKWESKGHELTGMSKPTEILLRLNVLTALPDKLWNRLEGPFPEESKPQSLKRLLDEIGRFGDDFEAEQPVMVLHEFLAVT
jgi:DNA-binding transcriptional regulator YiaG